MSESLIPFSPVGVASLAASRGDQPVWSGPAGDRTWADFGALVAAAASRCVAAGVADGEVVVIPGEERLESLAWGLGAGLVGAVVAPLRSDRHAERSGWTAHFRVAWSAGDGGLERVGQGDFSRRAAGLFDLLRARGHPGLILASGGTTGTPKLLLHDLNALLATVPVRSGRPWRTLPLMRFDHIGGLDMAWRALAGGQILVEPPPVISPQTVAATIARHRVEVLAATPSFLNLLLLSDAPRTHDLGTLRVVPYGAEAMPAGLLDRLRSALPAVEFVQRFGTSETGTLPVVAGEGGMRLRPGAAGYEWKVLGGELWVLSPGRALGYLSGGSDRWDESGWFQTGDLAESLSDGSIRVLGRMQDLINVGGEKVLPDEVESFLLGHPQVADCRVGAAANAVLGQVVAADVVWLGPERDPVAVRRLVQHYAEGRIARHKVPVAVRLVDSIASTRNGKKLRLASA
jgi:acyl-coenzyme A synthetase/AMP-(fatty) acid ligase